MIGLWDISSGTRIGELAHDSTVRDIAISRNGRYLVAAVMDGTLRVWDLVSRSIVHTYDDYPIAHTNVEISPDSKRILSRAEDGSLIMWRAIDRMSGVASGSARRSGSITLTVAPTPANGSRATITIDPAFTFEGRIALIDAAGNLRREIHVGPMQGTIALDISDLENGAYFIRASSGGAVVTEPMVVRR